MSIENQLSDTSSADAFNTLKQQIAHDLRAPLSALNFVSSLNPDMSEDSRALLQMAIDRLEEMALKLETK